MNFMFYKQPKFKLWPWKALALALPLVAALCAYLASRHSSDERRILTVFFIVLAASNGYLMAAAIGDLGRCLLAIPIGVCGAFAAVSLLTFGATRALFFLFICGLATVKYARYFYRYETTFYRPIALGLIPFYYVFVVWCAFDTFPAHGVTLLAVVLCYIFVNACNAGAMPARRGGLGRWKALSTGLRGGAYGAALGAAGGAAVTGVFWFFAAGLFGFELRGHEPFYTYFALVSGLTMANYFCIQLLFAGAARTRG